MAIVLKCDMCGLNEGTIMLDEKTQKKYRLEFTEDPKKIPFINKMNGKNMMGLVHIEAFSEEAVNRVDIDEEYIEDQSEEEFDYKLCNDCKKRIIATALFGDQ